MSENTGCNNINYTIKTKFVQQVPKPIYSDGVTIGIADMDFRVKGKPVWNGTDWVYSFYDTDVQYTQEFLISNTW